MRRKVIQFHHKNQFVVFEYNTLEKIAKASFQSYDSLICEVEPLKNKVVLHSKWDSSVTTLKHFYMFIREFCDIFEWYQGFKEFEGTKTKYIKKLIDEGTIEYVED